MDLNRDHISLRVTPRPKHGLFARRAPPRPLTNTTKRPERCAEFGVIMWWVYIKLSGAERRERRGDDFSPSVGGSGRMSWSMVSNAQKPESSNRFAILSAAFRLCALRNHTNDDPSRSPLFAIGPQVGTGPGRPASLRGPLLRCARVDSLPRVASRS